MRAMYVFLSLVLAFLSCAVLTVVSLFYIRRVVMMDFEAVFYGFPFPWIERVLCTFAGRTDYYIFRLQNLVIDVVAYFLLCFEFWFMVFLLKRKGTI